MTPAERERLVEETLTAHRERDPRGVLTPSSAFHDLDDEGRLRAYELALVQRSIEAGLDPMGRSTTVRAVLSLLRADPSDTDRGGE